MFSGPWYIFLLQFVAGLFLANGVPHFVQGQRQLVPEPFRVAARRRGILTARQCVMGLS